MRMANANSSGGLLPRGYQQVEYLLNPSSGQYIDTGVGATELRGLETKIMLKKAGGGWYAGFGCNSSSVVNLYCAARATAVYFVTGAPGTSYSTDNIHVIEWLNYTLTVDGVTIGTYNYNPSGATTLKLFRFGENGTDQTDTTIYYFKVYGVDGLIRDFIPCYRKSDNKTGMYDLVTDTFFANAGTGEFTVGNNV